MPTVAEQLRAAREAKNLSIKEVADITKIRSDHIRALEEGNFDMFVAPVYIRGFTRTYATLLKLDVPKLIKELEGELGKTTKFAEPPPLTDSNKGAVDFVMLQLSKVNLRTGAIILAVIVIGIIIAVSATFFSKRRSADPSQGVPPAKYTNPGKHAGETLPLPTTPAAPRK